MMMMKEKGVNKKIGVRMTVWPSPHDKNAHDMMYSGRGRAEAQSQAEGPSLNTSAPGMVLSVAHPFDDTNNLD